MDSIIGTETAHPFQMKGARLACMNPKCSAVKQEVDQMFPDSWSCFRIMSGGDVGRIGEISKRTEGLSL